MAKKMTKKARIEQKIAEGLDHLEAEMAVVKEDADAQLKRLQQKQKREQERIDEIAVSIVQEQYPEQWTSAQELAREQLDAQRTKRSAAASKQMTDVDQIAGDVMSEAPTPAASHENAEDKYGSA